MEDNNIKKIIKQLDGWLVDCDKQAKTFEDQGMVVAEITSRSMKAAYKNVKDKIITEYGFCYNALSKKDPVKHCETYKTTGCSHVDGYLCNMDTCTFNKPTNIEYEI